MANANITRPNTEILAGTGTVTPNSRDMWKELTLTANVTLNPPTGTFLGDEFLFDIVLGGFTLTLDAAYVSKATTPPVLAENIIMRVKVKSDGSLIYWVDLNEA